MSQIYSVYCDESCHLENDNSPVMVLGAIWCPQSSKDNIIQNIKMIKIKHGLSSFAEIKWTKVSPSKINYFIDVLDYFFDEPNLHFRAVVANKTKLDHKSFSQTHSDWYYKMYYFLINPLLSPVSSYHIFIDIKDSKGGEKLNKLHTILSNAQLDFERSIITTTKQIHSIESQLIQLADLLTGALCYANRKLATSHAKLKIVEHIRNRSGYQLFESTLLKEEKFNIFHWTC